MVGGLEELGRIVDMDILVVGAGFAGMWAALRAKKLIEDALQRGLLTQLVNKWRQIL